MFGNKRKTIGVFAEDLKAGFHISLCRGICTEAEKAGYNVAFFAPFGNGPENERFYHGDRQIYELPHYEDFDGVIVALDTMEDRKSRNVVLEQIEKRCSCPVVSIREVVRGANNLLVDNTTCMEGIIRHFIEEHGFTRICFMTGPKDHWDAKERLNCFMKEMKEHELPVEEHQVFYGDFWKHKGKEACDWFLAGPGRPQAIICANDYMALAVASELIGRGFRVPQDICVSGYDGMEDTLNFSPSITTTMVPFEKMGRKAVRIIRDKQDTPDLAEDYYFDAEIIKRESCGCILGNKDKIIQTRQKLHERIQKDKNLEMRFCFLSVCLAESATMEDFADKLSYYVRDMEGVEKYGVCLCDHLEEKSDFSGYTDTMELRIAVDEKEGGRRQIRVPFDRRELLPQEISGEEPQIWYFAPLHFLECCYGYEAFQFRKEEKNPRLYLPWNIIVSGKLRDLLRDGICR
jgi:DNA-binding LacI/PurR family transcriptional regulator